MLTETAITAAGGGTVLRLDADSSRPGHAHAIVVKDGQIVQITLDQALGTAVIGQTTTAPPSRRSVLALR